jgi:hypothetical protein
MSDDDRFVMKTGGLPVGCPVYGQGIDPAGLRKYKTANEV